ncbi:hypothetical protein Lfu02_78350 [Longispora fulva]|nr:hypothetical protein Lfu02_78350 [Longispora fulva]
MPHLREWVTELDLFFDADPNGGDEQRLHAIAQEWAVALRGALVEVPDGAGGGVMRQTPPANHVGRSARPAPSNRNGLTRPSAEHCTKYPSGYTEYSQCLWVRLTPPIEPDKSGQRPEI